MLASLFIVCFIALIKYPRNTLDIIWSRNQLLLEKVIFNIQWIKINYYVMAINDFWRSLSLVWYL